MPADFPAKVLQRGLTPMTGRLHGYGAYAIAGSGAPWADLAPLTTWAHGALTDGSAVASTYASHNGSTDLIGTATAHGLVPYQPVKWTTDGTLPASLSTTLLYYVRTVPSANSLSLMTIDSGTLPDVTFTPVDLSAASGSGTHTLHVGYSEFTITPTAEADLGLYDSLLSFGRNPFLGADGTRTLAVRWLVTEEQGIETAALNRFLGPVHEDPTVRDLRVDLRTGEVGGFYFSGGALLLPLGTRVNALLMLRDFFHTFVSEATDFRLVIVPANNFDATPLLSVSFAGGAATQFGAAASDTFGSFASLFGWPAPFVVDSPALRALVRAWNAGPEGASGNATIPATGRLFYTRGNVRYWSRPFAVAFTQ